MTEAPFLPPAPGTAPAGPPHDGVRPETAALPAQLRYSASSLALLDALARHQLLDAHAHDLPGQLQSAQYPAWELLTHAAELHRLSADLLDAAVVAVRTDGTSWPLIAVAVGGTRKSAAARYQPALEAWEQRLAAAPPTDTELDSARHALTHWWAHHRAEPHTGEEDDADIAALLDGLLHPPARREQLDRIRALLHAPRDTPLSPAALIALHTRRADLLAQQARESGDPDDADRAADAAARAAHVRHQHPGPTPTTPTPAPAGPGQTATGPGSTAEAQTEEEEEKEEGQTEPTAEPTPRLALADALATGSPQQVRHALSGIDDPAAALDATGATRDRALAALALTAASMNLQAAAALEISRRLYQATYRINLRAHHPSDPGLDEALTELAEMRPNLIKLPGTPAGRAFHAALTAYRAAVRE